MKNELSEEEVKKAIKEAEERMKSDSDMFKSQRKAAITWNIVFFIGILSSTIIVSVFTKFETFDIKELFKASTKDNIGIVSIIMGITVSFLTGILGSYYKTKSLKSKASFDAPQFLKETYLNRLDKSKINPQH